MVDYISKLEKLFNQLAGAGEVQKEKDKIYPLLSNLPSEYHPFGTLISNNLNFNDISYDHVCDRLILEHQQLTGAPTESPTSNSTSTSAFFSSQRGRGRISRGRNGHGRGYSSRGPNLNQTAWGTPERSQARRDGNEKSASTPNTEVDKDRCLYCKERGHWIRNCPKKQRGQDQQHSAHAAHTPKTTAIAWMASEQNRRSENEWILDSGASHHMSSQRQYFSCFREYETYIHIANGSRLTTAGIGDIWLKVERGDNTTSEIQLRDVLYVPDLGSQNLLSVRCIQQAGASVVFGEREGRKVEISKNNELIAIAELCGNSYILLASLQEQKNNKTANRVVTASSSGTLIEWHHCLGHLGFDDVKALAKKNPEIIITSPLTNPTCEHCIVGKQTRKPNSAPANHRAKEHLELIHSDLAGPMSCLSLGGAKYFLLFIDDFTRYTTVYMLKSKAEVVGKFREYKALVETYHSKKIKRFRSDGGGEYTSYEFDQLLKDSGITREKTAPYSPEQNGVSERANRTIIGRAKAMLHQSGLGMEMWGEAVQTAVYLKNRSPTNALEDVLTPLEAWTGEALRLQLVGPFGAIGYKHTPKQLRTKWEPNGQKCIFVGYEGTNQYRVLINKRIHITRDLTLIKPASEAGMRSRQRNGYQGLVNISDESEDDVDELPSVPTTTPIPSPGTLSPPTPDQPPQTPAKFITPGEFPVDTSDDTIHVRPEILPNPPQQEEEYAQRPRRANAGRFTSTRFRDEQFSQLAVLHNTNPPSIHYPHAFQCSTAYDTEPTTYNEAVTGPNSQEWKLAISEELASLAENNTWILTELPQGRSTVKCRWVFREKKGAEGETIRYKARLVAKSFTQQYGVDYLETYAPVVKLTSLRIILVLAAFYDFEIHQGDIKTAYLLGKLEDEIYMDIPEGISVPQAETKNIVCRLLRGLYGLKQSGRI